MTLSPRILLVDDEALLLRSFERDLGGRFDVTTADSAAHAEALLAGRNHYDLVVTDLTTPGIDGLDLLQRAAPPDTRFIVLTDGIRIEVHERASSAASVCRTLAKPIGFADLVEAIIGATAIEQHPASGNAGGYEP